MLFKLKITVTHCEKKKRLYYHITITHHTVYTIQLQIMQWKFEINYLMWHKYTIKNIVGFGSTKVVVEVKQAAAVVAMAGGARCNSWRGGADWPHQHITMTWLYIGATARVGASRSVCVCGFVGDLVAQCCQLCVCRHVPCCVSSELCVYGARL